MKILVPAFVVLVLVSAAAYGESNDVSSPFSPEALARAVAVAQEQNKPPTAEEVRIAELAAKILSVDEKIANYRKGIRSAKINLVAGGGLLAGGLLVRNSVGDECRSQGVCSGSDEAKRRYGLIFAASGGVGAMVAPIRWVISTRGLHRAREEREKLLNASAMPTSVAVNYWMRQ